MIIVMRNIITGRRQVWPSTEISLLVLLGPEQSCPRNKARYLDCLDLWTRLWPVDVLDVKAKCVLLIHDD